MGMMGSKGEMVGISIAPLIYITLLLNYLQINVNSITNTIILLSQGARGLDGDPGPQGVAGATVSVPTPLPQSEIVLFLCGVHE